MINHKMNILLINPQLPYPGQGIYTTYNRIWPPLCLLNIASLLNNQGHHVQLIDAHAKRLPDKAWMHTLHWADKVFITSSSLDRWQCPPWDMKRIIDLLSTCGAQKTEVYLMGYHGSVAWEQLFLRTPLRYIIYGEPEGTVAEICRDIPCEHIGGLMYKDCTGRIVQNPPRPTTDLDIISRPAWHMIEFNKYRYELLDTPFTVIETSRGCPYQCLFCKDKLYGNVFRQKSLPLVMNQIDELVALYRVRSLYFIDQIFTFERKFVDMLCDYLVQKAYPLTWACQTRPDLVDTALLYKMRKAGCVLIHFGVESGSEKVLKNIAKGFDLKVATNAVNAAKRAGMKTMCFFLTGLPNETAEDRQKTYNFAYRLKADYIVYRLFLDFPKFFTNSQDIQRYLTLPVVGKIKKEMRKEFLKFYLHPRQIWQYVRACRLSSISRKIPFFLRFLQMAFRP